MQDPISKNNAIYYESVKAYPDDYRGVKWESAQSQFLRFKILGDISPLIFNYSILDVGCGLGHLVDYLISRDFKGSYQGIDISYPMIAQAKKRHPNFTFEHNDIEHISEKSVEYVLASGIFAFSDFEQAKHTLSLLFSKAIKGVAVNFLSAYIPEDIKEPELFYAEPSKIFDFCKSLSPYVSLRHDYLENDFTVYLYKNGE